MNGQAQGNYLLEIGLEEVPARMAPAAAAELAELLVRELTAARLAPARMDHFSTPRRLIAAACGLPLRQDDVVVEKRGPAVRIAFDSAGNPTKAAEGFARGQGLTVAELARTTVDGEEYLLARKAVAGEAAATLLPAILERVLAALRFPKSMRWGEGGDSFVRPIHWLVSLLDSEVVPFSYAGITAGRTSRGHRFMGSGEPFPVPDADRLLPLLEERFVIADPARRRQEILASLDLCEQQSGLTVVRDEELLEEVVHLVEYPVVNRARFDEKFLAMPSEVLVTSMKHHQKFFAVRDRERLSNEFVVVYNTRPRDPAVVARGNVRVLAARLEDALFFFQDDRRRQLAEFVPQLAGQTFLRGLGSMADKAARVAALARRLGRELFGEEVAGVAARAGELAKADLATRMVFEFPELQGVMGREYALASGEAPEVARAIFEHYLPRFAGDELPASPAGMAVALADRLDTLGGCFHLGLIPTAAKDPYGLRRAALGVLRIAERLGSSIPLSGLLEMALENFGELVGGDREALAGKIFEFVRARLKHWLADEFAAEVVDACLAPGADFPAEVRGRCRAVAQLRGRPDYETLVLSFKRVINITRKEEAGTFDAALLAEPAEHELWQAFEALERDGLAMLQRHLFDDFLALLLKLKPTVDNYFDQVLVMCDDAPLRANRLAMLAQIGRFFLRFADFTLILA